jgi:anti-sigma regulatory factor (Ser/Thr protein kinase)
MKPVVKRPDSALADAPISPIVPNGEGELAYAVKLDGEPRSARLARHLAVAQLALWNVATPALVETLALVTAELAANAVTHGGESGPFQFELRLLLTAARLRVEVVDPNPRVALPEHADRPRPDAVSGRGLVLVAAYADSWGSEATPDAGTKTVWAEFER